MRDWDTALRSLPKAELHVHLEGTLEPEFRAQLAARNKMPDPLAGVDVVGCSHTFHDFMRVLDAGSTVLRTALDFADAVDAYLAQAHAYGVRHVEFAVDVQTHRRRGMRLAEVVEGVGEGFERWRDRDISGGIIATLNRHDAASGPAVLEELGHVRDGVLGLGVASDERSVDPTTFASEFALAASWGWGCTAHAVALPVMDAALSALHVDRIDHGFRAGERRDLVERLIEGRVALAACPITNVLVGPVATLRDHPLPALIRRGVKASLSTDDPAYFGCALDTVYTAAADEMRLTPSEVVGTAITSIESSFASAERKARLQTEIATWQATHLHPLPDRARPQQG